MTRGLIRFQQSRHLHFVTFSCHRRLPYLQTESSKHLFEQTLEQSRRSYRFDIVGCVVMPEHVHLLVTEPERATLATALKALKQSVARRLIAGRKHFWQPRYYDFNVWSTAKRIEKLKYLHRNPVSRGLVERPEDWPWSSYRHYAFGQDGTTEIASWWTTRKKIPTQVEAFARRQSRAPKS